MISPPPPVKKSSSREGFPTRVLVIDDESLIRWALSVGLTAAGFETVTAANAAEARREASTWPPPDAILLDVHQADCSQLLIDLRLAAPAARILVFGTRCDGQSERWQEMEVIAKPFDLADVIARIQRAVAP